MKAKLNLSIDKALLSHIRTYSESNKISISELVERYFYSISKSTRQETIVDIVEKLKPVKFEVGADLKKGFYEEQAGKYLF